MKDWILRVGSYIRVIWWVLVLVVVMVGGGWAIYFFVIKKGLRDGEIEELSDDVSVVGNVMTKIADATTDVKVNNAVIHAKTEIKKEEIRKIKKEKDGKKRREKLASALSNL